MKTKPVVINVLEGQNIPPSPYVLVKAQDGDYFYAVTMSELCDQQQKIVSTYKNQMDGLIAEFRKYKTDMDAKYAKFLLSYQEGNSKLIDMVDSVVNGTSTKGE